MNIKSFVSISIILVLSLFLVACGVNTETSSENEEAQSITLYSPNVQELNNLITKKFEEETGIKVEIVSGGTGELLKRVEAEKDNPLGDVFWAGGADSLEVYKEYFEPYEREEIDKLDPYFLKNLDYSWVPFGVMTMVLIYNKDLVDENDVPEGWEDLLDEKFKGSIAFADPNKSSSAYSQLVTMLLAFGEDEGWDYVEKFVENLDGKILSSSGQVPKLVADGEFSVGVTLESEALRYVKGGSNVGIIYPKEGTVVRPNGSALIKGAKNPEGAKKFLDFLLTKEIQEITQENFNRRSIRIDVEPDENVLSLDEIERVDYDIEFAAKNKDEIMEKYNDILVR